MIKPEIARIHGLLCADGMIEKARSRSVPRKSHRETAPDKVGWNYKIRFWSINQKLMNNFKELCERNFGVKVSIYKKRYEACIYSKDVYQQLIRLGQTGSHTWKMPLKKLDKLSLRYWIQGFFDGEATVSHHNRTRRIRVKSVNRNGLLQVKDGLTELGIQSKIIGPFKDKKSTMFYLQVSRKENLFKFRDLINFVHPEKIEKLNKMLKSYKK